MKKYLSSHHKKQDGLWSRISRYWMISFETQSLRKTLLGFAWFRLTVFLLLLIQTSRSSSHEIFLIALMAAFVFSIIFIAINSFKTTYLPKLSALGLLFDLSVAIVLNVLLAPLGEGIWLGLFYLVLINAVLFGRYRCVSMIVAILWLCIILIQDKNNLENLLFSISLHGLIMLSVGSTLGRLSRRSIYQEIRVQRASHKNTFLSILNNRILSQSLDGFIAIDHKGLVHASNPRCSQWLGIPRLAGFSLNSNERTLALKNHLAAGNINQRLRLPADPHHEEMTLQIHSLGETKIENTRLSIYTLHDISQDEHQQREEKLASLGRFTAGISHQIKNPIAAITQATELLSDPSTPSSQMPQLTALIKRNANRINNLVGHILSSFRLRPATDYVALESLMSSAITIFKSSHASDHHVLSVNPTPLCLVKFESTSFTEILCNLLDNAVSHCSHKDFSVRVEFLIRRGWVSILFRDDGAGVPMPSRDKIFEPFYTTRAQGIGLGLFVARELAHAQGALLFYKEDHTGHYFVLDIRTA